MKNTLIAGCICRFFVMKRSMVLQLQDELKGAKAGADDSKAGAEKGKGKGGEAVSEAMAAVLTESKFHELQLEVRLTCMSFFNLRNLI